MLSEAAEALHAAKTADGLDAAVAVAEEETFGYDDQGMALLGDFYCAVRPRLFGALACHHGPALDVIARTLHASTAKAAVGV